MGNTITCKTRSDEERATMEKRLEGAEDKGKPITVRRHDAKPPASTGKFGTPATRPIEFAPALSAPPPVVPSANAGDCASAMAVDPAPATQPAMYIYGCVALLSCCNMSVFWVEANFLEAKPKLARELGTWRAPTAKLARQVPTWRANS